MSEGVVYPKFLTAAWLAERLAISDQDAAKIGAILGRDNPEWDAVRDRKTFAEVYLSCHELDPGVGADCRRARGKGAPPLCKLPQDAEVPKLAADTSAKKALGHFAACARAAAERGKHDDAVALAALEIIEYGAIAEDAFALAQEVQHLKPYAAYIKMARSAEQTGMAAALIDEGLEDAEAEGEAAAQIANAYAVARLRNVADRAVDAAEDPVSALKDVAAALADAARASAAHMQISSAPLGTDTAVAVLRESVQIVEEHLEGAEDKDLMALAADAKKTADACKHHLIGRQEACEARLKAKDLREVAIKASSLADEAAKVVVKNLADAKKMEKGFLEANEVAKDACRHAIEVAKYISSQPKVDANDKEAAELFASIEHAFRGARDEASKDVEARAAAAAEAQRLAKQSQIEAAAAAAAAAKEAKAEKAAEKDAPAAPAAAGDDHEEVRTRLLAALDKFAKKRWDTNLATNTLKRLVDRRKEVIGMLWEAVETKDKSAKMRAEKFTDQFRNTMDARRRLDAVVRLMGRGAHMDPRTAKWFTDSILQIAALAKEFHDTHP
ncbi:MAG: hypothetical protein ISN26_07885 [Betaproteobacteria bacterium AqS2]|uniref:Uncharacterized protein n=1 Tax=Candidatus Amphirhobacter heronislandensis TaxID=1732024 RepID=A0A930UIQ4_9GAMM|nr:hypothetical protein [Betaproteobacteria bacterium AqS2]